jgi:CP family cyanate transporter-like MFS transporter
VNDKSVTTPLGRKGPPSLRVFLLCLGLLWIAGAALRMPMLAVPPLLPLIHVDLDLSETDIGILAGLPSLVFAAASVPSSLLIARFGAKAALVWGILLAAFAAAARAAAVDAATLFATTVAMAVGIAIMQPSLPPIVRAWLPDRIGLATAAYTNGLLVGEVLAVSLTVPLVLRLADGSWRGAVIFWSAVVLLIALVVGFHGPRPGATETADDAAPKWWPNWRDGRLWQLGLLFGSVNSIYFTTNAFLPDYLTYLGSPELVSPSLTALNTGQLPASFIMLALAGGLMGRPLAYAVAGLLCVASLAGILLMSGYWIVFWAGMIGFANAIAFVLILALPPLLSAPDDVHRTAAGMFTISYSCAVLVPIIGGLAWDASEIAMTAFAPVGVCALVITALPFGIDFHRRLA